MFNRLLVDRVGGGGSKSQEKNEENLNEEEVPPMAHHLLAEKLLAVLGHSLPIQLLASRHPLLAYKQDTDECLTV